MIRYTEMSELDTLNGEKQRLTAEIAAVAAKEAQDAAAPPKPGRKGAASPASQLEPLNRQLALLNAKISTAEARAAKA